jgi:hypothetical protein
MQETPDYFLEPQNVHMKNETIKTVENFIYNIIFELSKKT